MIMIYFLRDQLPPPLPCFWVASASQTLKIEKFIVFRLPSLAGHGHRSAPKIEIMIRGEIIAINFLIFILTNGPFPLPLEKNWAHRIPGHSVGGLGIHEWNKHGTCSRVGMISPEHLSEKLLSHIYIHLILSNHFLRMAMFNDFFDQTWDLN